MTQFVLRHLDDLQGPAGSAVPLLLFKARAWREHANALQAEDDLDGALDAVHHATNLLAANDACTYDHTVIKMNEAHIAWERGNVGDALRIIRESVRTFRELGDEQRWVQARLFEGMFTFTRDKKSAAAIFRDLLPHARELHDPRELARAFNNLLQCALELDDEELARETFASADTLFVELGMDAERPRLRWGHGRYLARHGQLERALSELQTVRADFEVRRINLRAATVSLDIAYVLQGLGRDAEARDLCRKLVTMFAHAGLTENAMTALAYVHDHADSIRPADVEHVRDFLERVETRPQLQFVPHT
jgi:tetratricopeptide (TPR) repeat protein